MCKKWRYVVGAVIVFGIMVFVCLNLFPLKYKINKSVNALKWEFDNAEINEKVTITMDGEYVKYILHFFREDYFQGDFSVSGYEFTEKADWFLYRVYFMPQHYNMGSLSYDSSYNYNGENGVLGTIYAADRLEQGVIMVSKTLGASENQQVISFPCEERAEAVALARALLPEGFEFE